MDDSVSCDGFHCLLHPPNTHLVLSLSFLQIPILLRCRNSIARYCQLDLVSGGKEECANSSLQCCSGNHNPSIVDPVSHIRSLRTHRYSYQVDLVGENWTHDTRRIVRDSQLHADTQFQSRVENGMILQKKLRQQVKATQNIGTQLLQTHIRRHKGRSPSLHRTP